jgi:drug/metabolite transporter (DMT)-like permease
MNLSPTMRAHLLMLLWAVLIATSFPAAALVANKISAVSLTALRFLCATVLFLPFVIHKGKLPLPNKKELLFYSVLAFCLVFYFWALFKALHTTTPLNTGAIFTLIPALTAVNAYILIRSTINKIITLAICIGCVGSFLVVIRGDVSRLMAFDFNDGDLIFLVGCIVLSLYSPFIQFFRTRSEIQRSAVYVTFWVMAVGTAMLFLVALVEGSGLLYWQFLDAYDISVVMYLAIFTTIITFWQLQYCTPVLGPVIVMSYTYLIPSIVFVIELLFFSKHIDEKIFSGILLTLVSLAVLNYKNDFFHFVKSNLSKGESL